jgi:hypothetical protein
MIVYINDRSLSAQFTDREEALRRLKDLAAMEESALDFSNLNPVRRTRMLADILILPNTTLRMFLFELAASNNPADRDASAFFLSFFVRGPYCTETHNANDTIVDEAGICQKQTCVEDAITNFGGAALLSIKRPGELDFKIFTSSIFGAKRLRNFTSALLLKDAIWNYDSNQKHERKKDALVEGLLHSAMDLDDETAKVVLRNGVLSGKSVFSKFGEQWYKFHRHTNNAYHGFPIVPKTPPKDFSIAAKFMSTAGVNTHGQFYADDALTGPD